MWASSRLVGFSLCIFSYFYRKIGLTHYFPEQSYHNAATSTSKPNVFIFKISASRPINQHKTYTVNEIRVLCQLDVKTRQWVGKCTAC